MDNKVLVSVRLDKQALEVIDKKSKYSFGYKRSDYIQAGVRLIAYLIDKREVQKFLQFYPEYGDVVDELNFKYHREHK